jgi:hypothetical protein
MRWKIPALWTTVAVIALTVTGVAGGLVVHGVAGALLGVVPGALAGVVAGFVPTWRDRAERKQAAEAAAQQAFEQVTEPAARSGDSSPAALLRADRGVVAFTGRVAELAALREWCGAGAAQSARVLTGRGGIGKTRLALRLAAAQEAEGWTWRLVAAGADADAMAAARGVTAGPVLLIADYAETRVHLGTLIEAVLADPGPVRLLLVARSLGNGGFG